MQGRNFGLKSVVPVKDENARGVNGKGVGSDHGVWDGCEL